MSRFLYARSLRRFFEVGFLVLVVALVLGCVGVAVHGAISYGSAIYRAYVVSDKWPSVIGVITASEAIQGCGRSGRGYFLRVGFRYSVNGIEYSGDRFWFGNGICVGRFEAEGVAAKFVPGASRFVYVNPLDPAESVLVSGRVENGTVPGFLFLAALPVMAMFFGVRLVMAIRRSRPSPLDIEQALMRRELIDRGIRLEIEERHKEMAASRGKGQDAK